MCINEQKCTLVFLRSKEILMKFGKTLLMVVFPFTKKERNAREVVGCENGGLSP